MPINEVLRGQTRQEPKRAPLRTKNAVALGLFVLSHFGGFAPDQIAAAALRGATRQPQVSSSASIEATKQVRQKRLHSPTYPTQYSQTETVQVQAVSQTGNHTPLSPTVRERISRSHGPDSAAISAFRQGGTADKTTGLGPKAKEEVSSGLQYGGIFENNPALATIASAGGNALWSFVDNLANFQLVSCSASPNVVPVLPTPEPTKVVKPTPTVEIVGGDFAKSLETPTPEMRSKYSQFYEYIENIKGAMMRQLGEEALGFKPKALIPDKATFESNLSQGAMPIVAIASADNPGEVAYAPAFWGADLRIVSMPEGATLAQPEGSALKTPIIMAPMGKDSHLVSFSPGLGVFVDQKFLPTPDQTFFTTLSTLQPKIVDYAKGELQKYDNVILTPQTKDGKLVFILESKTKDASHFAVMDKEGKITAAPDLPGKILKQDDDGTLRYYAEGKGANAGEYYPTEQTFNLLTLQVVEPTPTPTATVTSTPTPTPTPEATATPTIRHLLQETRPASFPLAGIVPEGKAPYLGIQPIRKDMTLYFTPGLQNTLPQDLLQKPDGELIVGWVKRGALRDAYTGSDNKIHLLIEVKNGSDRYIIEGILAANKTSPVFSYTSHQLVSAVDNFNLTINNLYKNANIAFYIPVDQIQPLKDRSIGTPQNPVTIYGGSLAPQDVQYFE